MTGTWEEECRIVFLAFLDSRALFKEKRVMRIQPFFFFSPLKVLLEYYEEEKQVPFNFTHSHMCMQTQTHTHTDPHRSKRVMPAGFRLSWRTNCFNEYFDQSCQIDLECEYNLGVFLISSELRVGGTWSGELISISLPVSGGAHSDRVTRVTRDRGCTAAF